VISVAVAIGLVACPHPEANTTKALTRLDLAKDFLKKHDLDAAENECSKAIALDHELAEAYNVRGLVSILRAVDTQRTLEVDACLTGVDAEATQKDLDSNLKKADGDFAQATKLAPDYGEAWSNRGVVHTLQEDYVAATEFLKRALDNPNRLGSAGLSRAHLGWALFHQKNYVDAAKELRQALQFQPNMCVATYRLARVYFAREEWEKAAELFQSASEDASCASQEASLFLMKTRLQQGLVDDARRARDACLKISPKSCNAIKCRADGGALGPSVGAPAKP
jgi:Tfp pilus assembly protein PilF